MNANQMMERMGFPTTERGPYVTQLRALVARQVSEGMLNRSGGTWAEECYERDANGFITGYKISHEERARTFLECEWAIENGHCHEIRNIDDYRPIGDRWRKFLMDLRILRDKILGRKNPFAAGN